jgi:type I restriction enzyme, S subunit
MTSLPKDWVMRIIDEVAEVAGGIQKGPNRVPGSNAVRYLTVAHVQRNRILTDDPRYFEVTLKELERWLLLPGDVLIIEGNGSAEEIGRTALFRGEIADCVHQNHVIRVRPNPSMLNSEFLNIFLNSSAGKSAVQALSSTSSGLRTLSVGRVKQLAIPCPPGIQQSQIATIICTWDKGIALKEIQIKRKQCQKCGLMQQLLSGRKRFNEFKDKKWQKIQLSAVMEQVTRRNIISCNRILTGSANHGLIDQRQFYSRRVASEDARGYYLIKRGEFAYNRSSAIGYPFGAIKRLDDYDMGVLSTLYLVFRIKEAVSVDSDFLDHAFEGGLFNAQLSRLCREGARSHGLLNITADEFFSMNIDLPQIEEQRKIAAVLSICDKEIELLQKQLELLNEQKRGLMQKLLTGEIRVKVPKGA